MSGSTFPCWQNLHQELVVINLHLSIYLHTSWFFSLYFLLIPRSRFPLLLWISYPFSCKKCIAWQKRQILLQWRSTNRGSCFRWWDLLLFFIKCYQIFSVRFHECSESTVAVHVITATLVCRWWDANIQIFSLLQMNFRKYFKFFKNSLFHKTLSVAAFGSQRKWLLNTWKLKYKN